MDTERQPWLPALRPPPGGPERFSRRLRKPGSQFGTRRWQFAMGATLVAFAVGIGVFNTPGRNGSIDSNVAKNIYQAEPFDRLLGRPIARNETTVVIDDEDVLLSRVDSSNSKVRIYRVD